MFYCDKAYLHKSKQIWPIGQFWPGPFGGQKHEVIQLALCVNMWIYDTVVYVVAYVWIYDATSHLIPMWLTFIVLFFKLGLQLTGNTFS